MHESNRPRGFEDRLLHELKNVVSERNKAMNSTQESAVKAPRFGRAAKFSLAGAMGAVALGVAAIVALPMLTASPAYAVETTEDGSVLVTINGPEDAEDLEETLADHGVQAEVEFPPYGYGCSDGWYTPAKDEQRGDAGWIEDPQEAEGDRTLRIEVEPSDFEPGGDKTLMINISEGHFDGSTEKKSQRDAAQDSDQTTVMYLATSLDTAVGEVGDCNVQPIEEPDDGDLEDRIDDKKNDDGSKSKTED